jgi:hypothetical protein
MEQALAVFLPEGMELVIFANSKVAGPSPYLGDVVRRAYRQHVRFN